MPAGLELGVNQLAVDADLVGAFAGRNEGEFFDRMRLADRWSILIDEGLDQTGRPWRVVSRDAELDADAHGFALVLRDDPRDALMDDLRQRETGPIRPIGQIGFDYDCRQDAAGNLSPLSNKSEAFLQCSGCKKILFSVDFEQNLRVCPHCGLHHRLPARTRIDLTFDEGSFEEMDADLRSVDPLEFPDYAAKLESSVAKTGQNDSMVSGRAKLEGKQVSVAVADFAFMGGSMGSVNGEKVTRTLERAAERQIPAIIFCASGGARMQEGLLSLMQMAKTTAAVQKCRESKAPFIAVFTDPTMAGVLASYASIADVILAEPKALVGFAGLRVAKQAGVGKVPDDFQTAEFAFNHGMIDRIVPRKEMRSTLIGLVKVLGGVLV